MEIIGLIDKIRLWQFTLFMSLILLGLGFTGQVKILSGAQIVEGKENIAIASGLFILLVSIGLRYLPPPERRMAKRLPRIAISVIQTALACSITEWTTFDEASKKVTSDHGLNKDDLQIKNTALRLELATMQGLLMRKIDDKNRHLVKYRYSDETIFQQD